MVSSVDLSAAYDTVNRKCLLQKILELTKDIHLTEMIEIMLKNRYLFVEVGVKKSRWQKPKKQHCQQNYSIINYFSPLLFNCIIWMPSLGKIRSC